MKPGKKAQTIPRAVIFDLDGTLLDTLDDLANAMNAVLSGLGLQGHDREKYKRFVGDGVRNLVLRVLPEERRGEEALAERVSGMMREIYGRDCLVSTRPYTGIQELLSALRGRKMKLAVLSNKPHPMTTRLVEHFFPDGVFEAVYGQREDMKRKPDPDGALLIAEELGLPPGDFAYVGDTDTDMLTARAAGMRAVGALWGFRDAAELLDNGADVLISEPRELLRLFKKSRSREHPAFIHPGTP